MITSKVALELKSIHETEEDQLEGVLNCIRFSLYDQDNFTKKYKVWVTVEEVRE